MIRMLTFLLVALLAGLILHPSVTHAVPNAACLYKLYHYEGSEWVRYEQGDPFPPDGADPGTNLWKYNYWVANLAAPSGIYQLYVYFNSDDTLRAVYSSATSPTGWSTPTYFPPISPHNNWKVRFRTTNAAYYVMPGDTLGGYEVQFTWLVTRLPGQQNYDVAWSGGSEPGNTTELPPDCTPVEAATWSKIKGMFR